MHTNPEYHVSFCDQWEELGYDKREESAQEDYIGAELERLVETNQPVLRAILAHPNDWVQFTALRLVREGVNSRGNATVHIPSVMLRLVAPDRLEYEHPDSTADKSLNVKAAAVPPPRDPQGRPLPKEKRGKVLVAKVGNLGGNIPIDRDARETERFGGVARDNMARTFRTLYITREITRQPAQYSLRDAILILRQWGFGIGDTVFRSVRSEAHKREPGQCLWLVEEVGLSDLPAGPQAPAKPTKGG